MSSTANNIAISFEVGDIASAVGGINDLSSAMLRLGQASGSAMAPMSNPFAPLMTALTALPGAAGKAALALRAISEVATDLYNLHGQGAQQTMNFGYMANALNSSGSTTALLQGLGQAQGVDMQSLAHAVRMQALDGGMGTVAAGKLGYPITPQQIPMDEGQALADLIRRLQEEYRTNPDAARFDARNLNEALLKWAPMSPGEMQAAQDQGNRRGKYFGPQQQQEAADEAMQRAIRQKNWEDIIHGRLSPGELWDRTIHQGGGSQRMDKQNDHLKKNTQALQDNTEQISKLNGIYGGGARMRSAIPRSFQGRGDQLDAILQGEKAKFGAFAVTV
jgi:hypothetical protein